MRLLFTAAIFLAATLLFMVQPLAGKMLLPVVGGSPAVWTTCMLFFQAALLAGYLYSHIVTSRLPLKHQVGLHGILLLIAVAWLPFAPPLQGPPDTGTGPLLAWMLGTLTSSVGIPFLLVSTSGPLLQRWFSNTTDIAAKDPYFLYAASNLGSAVGLLGYPFILERNLNIAGQSVIWAGGYALLVLMLVSCGVAAAKSARPAPTTPTNTPASAPPAEPIAWSRRLRWIVLAAVPSSLMIGVTQHISTDLAAVPLLWVIPLFLYLLTFSAAFSPKIPLSAAWLWWAFAIFALIDGFLFMTLRNSPFLAVAGVHLVGFTLAALMCHRQLADDRPSPARLTEFFFWIALGGVLGGLFNAVVAPTCFTLVFEYPIALAACLWMLPGRAPLELKLSPIITWIALPVAAAAGVGLVLATEQLSRSSGMVVKIEVARAATAMVIVMGLAAFFPIRLAVAFFIAAVCSGHWHGKQHFGERTLLLERSFFGVHHAYVQTLKNPDGSALTHGGNVEIHRLSHGTTLHGSQLIGKIYSLERGDFFNPANIATTYYHAAGPTGDAMRLLSNAPIVMERAGGGLLAASELVRASILAQAGMPETAAPMAMVSAWAAQSVASRSINSAQTVGPASRVAVLGLGSGTMAAYARKGDHYTFYEIDPVVARFATDPAIFTFISDAKARGATIDIIPGDGRLGIANAKDGEFGLIILDAFSSDSIPVHLMTKEALAIYMSKLRPDGMVMFHISNRFFDLRPILANLAADAKLAAYLGESDKNYPATEVRGVTDERKHYELLSESWWTAIGKTPAAVQGFAGQKPYWVPLQPRPDRTQVIWTDDFTDVLAAFNGWKN